MPNINITRNFQSITAENLPSVLEAAFRDLEDQLSKEPQTFVRLTEDQAYPEGMKAGTIVYDISSGTIITKIWNGKEFIT